ncbi:HAD-IIB family hydrolase [Kocuria massiliensis]|uniref:HAD-IIB family hydrolase n=1 Tax=Kocuria massiliensis TaxID=1926282 RepID=UPI000A1C8B0A|nr:HAD family hydrolase [Kocuria massiliensis]MCT1368037.1 Cof-type HAD-IIB family hydrolase [Rothia sp. p3-SID1597]
MSPQLMAFDLDGTLVFDQKISAESVEAIHEWQAAGNLAVCSTGKSIAATIHALQGTGLRFDYYVLYTGGAVTDADFRVLTSHTIPNVVVREIVETLTQEQGIAVYGTTLESDHDAHFPSTTGSKSSSILAHFAPMAVEDIPHHEFVGIPLFIEGNEERMERTTSWIRERFHGQVDCHRNQDFLDVVPPSCTKGTGLAWLDEAYLGGRYETYSIGDSWNDLAMHAWAQHSASFPYSPLEVQDATDTVVATAAEYIRSVLKGSTSASS